MGRKRYARGEAELTATVGECLDAYKKLKQTEPDLARKLYWKVGSEAARMDREKPGWHEDSSILEAILRASYGGALTMAMAYLWGSAARKRGARQCG